MITRVLFPIIGKVAKPLEYDLKAELHAVLCYSIINPEMIP